MEQEKEPARKKEREQRRENGDDIKFQCQTFHHIGHTIKKHILIYNHDSGMDPQNGGRVGESCVSQNCGDINSCHRSVNVSPLLSSLKFKL